MKFRKTCREEIGATKQEGDGSGQLGADCVKEPGHSGAHENGAGAKWRIVPELRKRGKS